MQRSRRLLFVLSPNFLAEKSFSLLECRLGLYLQHGHRASIVAVVYRSVSKLPCVEVAQLRQATGSTVTWRGSRSEPLRSRFWLRLRLVLPVRPLALGRRLIDSTSSHSDLAALALQRAQRIQNQRDRANPNRRNRQAPPRGRGRASREHGSLPSMRCSGCAGQVEAMGVAGQVEAMGQETQQSTPVRTGIQSDPVQDTDHPPISDTQCLNPTPIADLPTDPDSPNSTCGQDDTGKHDQDQVTDSRTSF